MILVYSLGGSIKAGWMLDGYPRTIPQAEALDKILPALGKKIDVVLNVDVPDAELIKRVTGRRMCKCGTTYHVQFNPPKVACKCDACGADLYQRQDDTEATVQGEASGLPRSDPAPDRFLQQEGHCRQHKRHRRYQGHLRQYCQGSG